MRAAVVSLGMLVLGSSALASEGPSRRFAVVAGASDGGPTRTTLRYSTSDAREVARVLRRLGGVALDDLLFVAEPDAAGLKAALGRVAAESDRARKAGQRVELFLYFSGHSDESGLLLGRTRLTYADLRAELELVPADVRVAILDSCSSGAITRAKGGVHRPPFLLDASSTVKGHAFLTSSAADEASQESERLKGSFFTHALLTGLRGGADASNDGVVTLQEAYQFAFRETLARTETTQGGPQHATYDIGLVGSGDVVMTDLRRADAVLVIPTSLEGTVFVRNSAGQLVAELRKVRGAGVELALEEGRYDVRVSLDRNVSSTSVDLASSARVTLDPGKLVAGATEPTTLRGDSAGLPPLALPVSAPPSSAERAEPPALAAAIGPAGPVRGAPSWASLSAGTLVPQYYLRGTGGPVVQAAVGTWLFDFLGIEASAGYYRLEGDLTANLPATTEPGSGVTFTGDSPAWGFPVRETVSGVPLEATLKLGVAGRGLRPYLLGSAGLEYVRIRRQRLDRGSTYPFVATSDRAFIQDVAPRLAAGLGATFRINGRVSGVVEGRFQYLTAKNDIGSRTGKANLQGVRLTMGVQYLF